MRIFGKIASDTSALIILFVSLGIRIILASMAGAGYDEVYYYTYSLHPALSYFDHPPVVSFLSGFFPLLTGITNSLTIRLAGLLLFSATSILLYNLSCKWVSAAVSRVVLLCFNFIPLFLIGIGIAVLPDAGLAFFWTCALFFVHKIIHHEENLLDWIWCGLFTGLAFLSKYHGALFGCCLFLYVAIHRRDSFLSKGPWLYALTAILCSFPVLIWNMQHDFVSFTFQGNRALGLSIDLVSFFQALGGQLAYVTPMAFIPFCYLMYKTVSKGLIGKDLLYRECFYFGTVPVSIFLMISFVRPILPHWTLPGYLLLCIPLGVSIQSVYTKKLWARILTKSSFILILVLLALIALQGKYGILHLEKWVEKKWISQSAFSDDPTLDPLGWHEVILALKKHRLSPDSTFLFSHKWFLCAQLSMAAKKTYPIACFNTSDTRGFGFWTKPEQFMNKNGIGVFTNQYPVNASKEYESYFQSIQFLDSLVISRSGVPSKTMYLYYGLHMIKPYPFWVFTTKK